ncbi:MAG: hypothetical protein WBZ36_16575 [Candidatus Nitrosopolaris sp.]
MVGEKETNPKVFELNNHYVFEKHSHPSSHLFYAYYQDDYKKRRIADYQPTTKTCKKRSFPECCFNAIIGLSDYPESNKKKRYEKECQLP